MQNEELWEDFMWDSFIKREELESSPGVIDENMIRALTLNTYLLHIRELILDGSSKYPFWVVEHLEDVMMMIFMDYMQVVEGRHPELDEISDYLKKPENVEARKKWTLLCYKTDLENWPEVAKQLRGMLPEVDLSRINWDTEERRQNAEKMRKLFEEKGYIEL